jgi:hypothetical protein
LRSGRNGVRFPKVWQRLLGVERTVVESVVFDEDEEIIVASVRTRKHPHSGLALDPLTPGSGRWQRWP